MEKIKSHLGKLLSVAVFGLLVSGCAAYPAPGPYAASPGAVAGAYPAPYYGDGYYADAGYWGDNPFWYGGGLGFYGAYGGYGGYHHGWHGGHVGRHFASASFGHGVGFHGGGFHGGGFHGGGLHR